MTKSPPTTTNVASECGSHDPDLLASCVHCGFCLEVCPTYKLTGDENNSPRGRLRLWREEAEGRLVQDPWTDFYTAECVGCLACESACPANVPYGEIFEQVKHAHVATGRSKPPLMLRLAARLAARPFLFNLAMLPARLLRQTGLLRHRFLFPGRPAVLQSTADYARQLMSQHRPTGPRVALLTGCLMESLFREINFATVRVLIENNIQVVIPPDQGCCGAFQEHTGMAGVEALRTNNRQAFGNLDVEAIVSNSSGCGLALSKGLEGTLPVRDVLSFLGEQTLVSRPRRDQGARVYVDLPCHLIHGQKVAGIPTHVLNATGYSWELAPQARDCCGSGGVYNIQKPENSREILAKKSAFLNQAAGKPVILATSNHVCMMQWNSARSGGLVTKPYEVRHVIQLLDPGETFTIRQPS
ncbi:MAG: 4Fe-4S dicluster domain-containing protein [Planctomycetota bacterium]|nr:MAG: 4Fe-4S dicluster domain-containing protein [Planctomycetota bacterium]